MRSLLLLSAAFAAAPPPPIVNGEETAEWPEVGALVAFIGDLGGVYCSATVVHPRFAITAAHCVEAMNADFAGANFWFASGTDVINENGVDAYVEVVSWTAHPDYNAEWLQNDIGFIEFDSDLNVPLMPLNTDPPDDTWVGTELDYVGWGITGDYNHDSGIKRTAAIQYDGTEAGFIFGYDAGGSNLCSGDSGGAALERQDDGTWELAGVNSFVYSIDDPQAACIGGGNAATRVDAHISWLTENIDLDAQPAETDTGEEENTISGGGSFVSADDEALCATGPAAVGVWALIAAAMGALRRRASGDALAAAKSTPTHTT